MASPISNLVEICSFIRVPYNKAFEKNGTSVRCKLTFFDTTIETGDWFNSQKEAEQAVAAHVLSSLPIRKADELQVFQRGVDPIKFQAVATIPSPDGVSTLEVTSEWMSKKVEAKRELLHKLVQLCVVQPRIAASRMEGDRADEASSASAENQHAMASFPLQSVEHYVVAKDETHRKVETLLLAWQKANLAAIKQTLGPLPEPEPAHFDSLLTLAFIHPSFTHTEELQGIMRALLGTDECSYERLEFFGDAILEFLVTRMLFEEKPPDSPGNMTLKRQALVREEACCGFLKKLRFSEFIIHRDILQTPTPATMCDVFEAILGALYVSFREESYPAILRILKLGPE